jgi:hypothetical protein
VITLSTCRRRRAPAGAFAIVLLLVLLVTAGPAAATGGACGTSSHMSDLIARVCDRSDTARDVVLRFSSGRSVRRERLDREVGFADVGGDEPLLPGETVELTWKHIGPKAHLVVRAAQPLRGTRMLRIALRPPDVRTAVTVTAAGTITIVQGARTTTKPEVPLEAGEPGGPPAVWSGATPAGAVRAAVRALRLRRPSRDLGVLCAGFEPDVSAAFAEVFEDRWGTYPYPAGCGSVLAFNFYVAENMPTPHGTTGAVRWTHTISATEAVVRVRLHHRYEGNGVDPTDRRVTADVVVVRPTASAPWRIATPMSLLPHPVPTTASLPHSIRQLRAARARVLGEARDSHAQATAFWAPRDRAAVTIAPTATPCPAATTLVDPVGDLAVWDRQRTRDPSPLGADLRSATLTDMGAAGICLVVRLAPPIPPRFTLDLQTAREQVTLSVRDGRALLVSGSDDGDSAPRPVSGVHVGRSADALTVRLPPGTVATVPTSGAWSVDTETYGRYLQVLDDELPDAPAGRSAGSPTPTAAGPAGERTLRAVRPFS